MSVPPAIAEASRLFLLDPRVGATIAPSILAAVEAWGIRESGGRVLRNNPWNLHGPIGAWPGQIASDYVSADDPDVAVFSSLAAGVAAAVSNLVRAWRPAEAVAYGYDKVLAEARAGDGPGFLAALAASSWSAGRYGTKGGGPNSLLPIYRGIIGSATSGGTIKVTLPTTPTARDGDLAAAQQNLIYAERQLAAGAAAKVPPYLEKAFAQIAAGESHVRATAAMSPATPQASATLTPAADPSWPASPAQPIIPALLAAFVTGNPGVDTSLASRIATALGDSGYSAQGLSGLRGLIPSTTIPGLIVDGRGLPIYETSAIASGTVLADGDLGGYVQGAWFAPDGADGHRTTAFTRMETDHAPGPFPPGPRGAAVVVRGVGVSGASLVSLPKDTSGPRFQSTGAPFYTPGEYRAC